MSAKREAAIERIVSRTGKTREQAEAFLDLVGMSFARPGWTEDERPSDAQIAEKVDVFLRRSDPEPTP